MKTGTRLGTNGTDCSQIELMWCFNQFLSETIKEVGWMEKTISFFFFYFVVVLFFSWNTYANCGLYTVGHATCASQIRQWSCVWYLFCVNSLVCLWCGIDKCGLWKVENVFVWCVDPWKVPETTMTLHVSPGKDRPRTIWFINTNDFQLSWLLKCSGDGLQYATPLVVLAHYCRLEFSKFWK
mgnify:CR=1 FL=1